MPIHLYLISLLIGTYLVVRHLPGYLRDVSHAVFGVHEPRPVGACRDTCIGLALGLLLLTLVFAVGKV